MPKSPLVAGKVGGDPAKAQGPKAPFGRLQSVIGINKEGAEEEAKIEGDAYGFGGLLFESESYIWRIVSYLYLSIYSVADLLLLRRYHHPFSCWLWFFTTLPK